MTVEELGAILESVDTLVVVGCSANPAKEAHSVPEQLQKAGFRIIPVNPRGGEILGEKAYASLDDVPGPIEFVNLFRPGPATPPFARQAAQRGARILWLQEGIVSEESRAIAAAAGMTYVEDACVAVVRAVNRIVKPSSAER
ncbi:MAG: CoA-binding protein [Acidimicrobiales bacterium]